MFGLVLILLLGLLVNRCAHLSAGQQVQLLRLPQVQWRVHRAARDVQGQRALREAERTLEQAAEQLERALEGAGRNIEKAVENAGEAGEEVGRAMEGIADRDGDKARKRTRHPASTVYVLLLGAFAPQEMTIANPPSHLELQWSDGESQVRVETSGREGFEAPAAILNEPRKPKVSFAAPLERARIAFPPSIAELRLEEPYGITLQGGTEKLDIRLHDRAEVSLTRAAGTLTLATDEWALAVQGANGEVRMLDRRGRLLRSLAAGEEASAPEAANARDSKGGDS